MKESVYTLKITRHGGAMIARVTGYYTPEVALVVRDRVNRELAHRHAVKVVLDLRGAVWLMTEAEWGALREKLVQCPIAAPMGVLVLPEGMRACWDHCMSMMERGSTRVPFDDLSRAARWSTIPEKEFAPVRTFLPSSSADPLLPPGSSAA